MIREGWLLSEDGIDARSKRAKVTKKGHRVLAKANKSWELIQHRVIDKFGRPAYASLLEELNRLAECGRAADL
jgi:DNA-binding MarR family transcriptional regulator